MVPQTSGHVAPDKGIIDDPIFARLTKNVLGKDPTGLTEKQALAFLDQVLPAKNRKKMCPSSQRQLLSELLEVGSRTNLASVLPDEDPPATSNSNAGKHEPTFSVNRIEGYMPGEQTAPTVLPAPTPDVKVEIQKISIGGRGETNAGALQHAHNSPTKNGSNANHENAAEVVKTKNALIFLEIEGTSLAPMAVGLLNEYLRRYGLQQEIEFVAATLAPPHVSASKRMREIWIKPHPYASSICHGRAGIELSSQSVEEFTPQMWERLSERKSPLVVVINAPKEKAVHEVPVLKNHVDLLSLPEFLQGEAGWINNGDPLVFYLTVMPALIHVVGKRMLSREFNQEEILAFLGQKNIDAQKMVTTWGSFNIPPDDEKIPKN